MRIWSFVALLALTACDGTAAMDAGSAPDAGVDAGQLPDDGWAVSTPAAEGMDADGLDALMTYAFADGRNTQGVVVVRNGAIVAERYAPGRDRESWAASWSVGKSVASALIGIAIEEGLIANVDVPLTDYYPEWVGTERDGITLRHVLQQTTGLAWDENYDPSGIESSDVINIVLTEDSPLEYVLQRPQATEPGAAFVYSSGNSLLLSGILAQATGMSAGEYAQARLFGPLGLGRASWWSDTEGTTLTYCCLDMRSRDFARFGQLYLDNGRYEGAQIVPEAWITESLEASTAFDGYGYQWWLDGNRQSAFPSDTYAAHGHDGQHIFVVPSLDLVVVRNGTYDRTRGEAVASPSLFVRYPSGGLVANRGTVPPDSWSDREFLGYAFDAVID